MKKLASLIITLLLVAGANELLKSGVMNIPDPPRPKSGVMNIPDPPRPKSGVMNIPDPPRP